jgi:hypothetical protein
MGSTLGCVGRCGRIQSLEQRHVESGCGRVAQQRSSIKFAR